MNSIQELVGKENVYFDLQQESSPIDVSLENYIQLYERLRGDLEYGYDECYLQYLENTPEYERFYDYETETLRKNCGAVLCAQISESIQNRYELKCCEGKLFDRKDFQYCGDRIPVLLGCEYRDVYKVGFGFTATYLYNTYNFEVVGILEENSAIQDPSAAINLDKYIVMPSFNVCDTRQDNDGIRIHYANKTSGQLIIPKEKFAEASKHIKQLLASQECGYYTVDISPVKYNILEKTGVDMEVLMAGSLIIFVAFLVLYYWYAKKTRQYYAKKRVFFLCAELTGTVLLFLAAYVVFLSPLIAFVNIRILGASGIFILAVKYI